MNKCRGCGVSLQNKNVNELGFVKNIDDELCERCFRIKHYNDYKRVIKDNDYVLNILKKLSLKIMLLRTIMNQKYMN